MSLRMRRLFFHEMRSNRWFLLMALMVVVFYGFYLYSAIGVRYLDYYNYYSARYGSILSEIISIELEKMSIVLFVGLAVMTTFQFSSQKVGATREFMSGLPYKRNELFGMKYFSGMLTITLPTILYAIECFVIRHMCIHDLLRMNLWSVDYEYTKANETIEVLLLNILMFWLTCLALYSIYMLMQVLIHPPLLAMVVGMMAAMFPYYMFHQLREFMHIFSDKAFETGLDLKPWFGSALGQREYPLHGSEWNSVDNAVLVVFDNIPYYLIVFIAIFIITTILSFAMNKRQETAAVHIFSYPIIEKIFLICLGIGFGMTMFIVPEIMKYGWIGMMAMAIFVGWFSVHLAKKTMERYSS